MTAGDERRDTQQSTEGLLVRVLVSFSSCQLVPLSLRLFAASSVAGRALCFVVLQLPRSHSSLVQQAAVATLLLNQQPVEPCCLPLLPSSTPQRRSSQLSLLLHHSTLPPLIPPTQLLVSSTQRDQRGLLRLFRGVHDAHISPSRDQRDQLTAAGLLLLIQPAAARPSTSRSAPPSRRNSLTRPRPLRSQPNRTHPTPPASTSSSSAKFSTADRPHIRCCPSLSSGQSAWTVQLSPLYSLRAVVLSSGFVIDNSQSLALSDLRPSASRRPRRAFHLPLLPSSFRLCVSHGRSADSVVSVQTCQPHSTPLHSTPLHRIAARPLAASSSAVQSCCAHRSSVLYQTASLP